MGTARDARAALWARYDAGELGTDELDARLRAVDRAGDDPAALAQALTGPVRTPRPGRRRALPGVAVVAAVALGGIGVVSALDDADEPGGAVRPPAGVDLPAPLPGPAPGIIEPSEDCRELEGAEDALEAVADDDPPANPAPLSDPPAVPEGYTFDDEVTFAPGTDPDLPMSIAAGDPPPVEVHARALAGPLAVTMRAFVHESAEAAAVAARSVAGEALCAYVGEAFAHPEHPEVTGVVISGVIPTTAFANWRIGERRFTVSVVAAIPDDSEATAEAQELAAEIAVLELEAARTAP